jgi:hypothetical protein
MGMWAAINFWDPLLSAVSLEYCEKPYLCEFDEDREEAWIEAEGVMIS